MSASAPPATAHPVALGSGLRAWLGLVALLVFLMALIGAITRLTESGLSIVEWRPITGALPPLTDEAWEREFALYRDSPQYRLVNRGMSLAEFQWIYFWEWLHRLWGRLIGLVYGLPALWLIGTQRVAPWLAWRLGALLALGLLQGFVGWFMVQSGLVDRPEVSHLRLALHLGLACLIFAGLIWVLLSAGEDRPPSASAHPRRREALTGAGLLALLLGPTIVWGAFVAGTDAGRLYNSFPLMGGQLMPDEVLLGGSPALNLVTLPGAIQFLHRVLAFTLLALGLWQWWRWREGGVDSAVMRWSTALAVMLPVQAVLGIATVLVMPAIADGGAAAGAVIALATAHQGGALVLVALATRLVFAAHSGR